MAESTLVRAATRGARISVSYSHRFHWQIGHRCFSTLLDDAVVHKRGDPGYGTREYVLLPPHVTLDQVKLDSNLVLASLYAHKNIIFGARVVNDRYDDLIGPCTPLLQAALQDAAELGEQPQAVATLTGLCDFVVACLDNRDNVMHELDPVSLEACRAMATGIPRPGHSVVGVGTYRDGQYGWEAFAREFVNRDLAQEPNLYKSQGGQLVSIEHLADQSQVYMTNAGGTMCRLFFL